MNIYLVRSALYKHVRMGVLISIRGWRTGTALIKDNTVTNPERNLRVLAIEMYKIAHNLAPTLMRNMMIKLDAKHCATSTCKVTIQG